jgi:anti-sigma regulatory factor (Ser/Thr protein kinase)
MLLQITERSQVAEARRIVSARMARLGVREAAEGKLSLAITEMGTNLVKHAGGGEIVVRTVEWDAYTGVELLAIDKGPGMPDVNECMRDGFSTSGSPGTGLGAIARASDDFDIYTQRGRGTVLMARFKSDHASPSPIRNPGFQIEVLALPISGEDVSGDSWSAGYTADGVQILVVDGLGHGEMAARAAAEAVNTFQHCLGESPAALMNAIHGALRSTRGAAGAVAEIDFERGSVHYAGVGNIVGAVLMPEKLHRMVSHNGTLGHELRKVQEFAYPWSSGALLVMHSDGLATHWDLNAYPGLASRHPSIIAAVLYRDHTRGRDDVTVLVAREELPT